MNFSHALAQAAKHERWHRNHPEGGCESSLCEHDEPSEGIAADMEYEYA